MSEAGGRESKGERLKQEGRNDEGTTQKVTFSVLWYQKSKDRTTVVRETRKVQQQNMQIRVSLPQLWLPSDQTVLLQYFHSK